MEICWKLYNLLLLIVCCPRRLHLENIMTYCFSFNVLLAFSLIYLKMVLKSLKFSFIKPVETFWKDLCCGALHAERAATFNRVCHITYSVWLSLEMLKQPHLSAVPLWETDRKWADRATGVMWQQRPSIRCSGFVVPFRAFKYAVVMLMDVSSLTETSP